MSCQFYCSKQKGKIGEIFPILFPIKLGMVSAFASGMTFCRSFLGVHLGRSPRHRRFLGWFWFWFWFCFLPREGLTVCRWLQWLQAGNLHPSRSVFPLIDTGVAASSGSSSFSKFFPSAEQIRCCYFDSSGGPSILSRGVFSTLFCSSFFLWGG